MDGSLLAVLGIALPVVVWIFSLTPRDVRDIPVSKEEVLALRGVRWPDRPAVRAGPPGRGMIRRRRG